MFSDHFIVLEAHYSAFTRASSAGRSSGTYREGYIDLKPCLEVIQEIDRKKSLELEQSRNTKRRFGTRLEYFTGQPAVKQRRDRRQLDREPTVTVRASRSRIVQFNLLG